MFKFFLIALTISGYTYAGTPTVTVESSRRNRLLCPYLNGDVKVTYVDPDSDDWMKAKLTISCAEAGTSTKTVRFSTREMRTYLTTLPFPRIKISKLSNAKPGDQCTAAVAVTGNPSRNASRDFTISFPSWGYEAIPKITSAVKVGSEFRIENLFIYKDGTQFRDLLLRECAALEDPWVFRYNNRHDGYTLKRVYPVSITSEEVFGGLGDVNPNNDNACLGFYDGFIGGLFTLGSDYTDCKLKLSNKDVTGGDSFIAMGAPQLAASARVIESAGRVLLNTGSKPTNPAGINGKITVYISNNRGRTWSLSKITSWTTTAADTGITATTPSDNTTNMALIAISDSADTKRWWRIVKGK